MDAPPVQDPRPSIVTERLRGEPVRKDHAPVMVRALADEAIYRFLDDMPPSIEELERQYAFLNGGISPDGREHWLTWVLRLRAAPPEQLPVGFMQATIREPQTVHVGYVIVPTHQRAGLGREAVTGLLACVFEHYTVGRAVAEMDTGNHASRALVESLGFQYVETVRNAAVIRGRPSHEHVYELPAALWRARRLAQSPIRVR